MNDYPVSKDELWTLGGLGLGATLAFSSAAGLLGFFVDTKKDLELAQGIPPETVAYWRAREDDALILMVGCLVAGVLFFAFGALKVRHIINSTKFSEGENS